MKHPKSMKKKKKLYKLSLNDICDCLYKLSIYNSNIYSTTFEYSVYNSNIKQMYKFINI